MKKLIFIILLGIITNTSFGQDCGGAPTGMNITNLSTTAMRVQFYRPLKPEKYWSNKDIKEYESYFQIRYKVYFNQAGRPDWVKDIDTSVIEKSFQITANEHSSTYDILGLIPGLSYEVCIYTNCGNNKFAGPLCYFSTLTSEAPCTLEFSPSSTTAGRFKFIYKPFTNVLAKQIIFEYREQNGDWKIVDVNDGNSVYIDDFKPGSTYFARIKFVYYNDVVSSYSDILLFSL